LALAQLAYYNIMGLPVVAYVGMTTLLLVVIVGIVGFMVLKGKISFSWHKWLAITAIVFAFVHAVLAMSAYL
jgi:hypothetical protein